MGGRDVDIGREGERGGEVDRGAENVIKIYLFCGHTIALIVLKYGNVQYVVGRIVIAIIMIIIMNKLWSSFQSIHSPSTLLSSLNIH